MNILQSLSLIPICLGAALPLNSSGQSSTQSNLPVYETNIQYQYETNDVNSNDDLVVGNIYLLHFEPQDIQQTITYTLFDNLSNDNILYNYIVYATDGDYRIAPFQYKNINGKLFPLNFYLFTIKYNYSAQHTTAIQFNFNSNSDNVVLYFGLANVFLHGYSIDFVIVLNSLDFTLNEGSSFTRCPTEYIPYILVEPQVSDNIYVNLYDFYYDLFQNEGINSITFEIGTQNISLSSWIAHSLTIITLIVLVVITILFVIWLFKFLSGFILLRQS